MASPVSSRYAARLGVAGITVALGLTACSAPPIAAPSLGPAAFSAAPASAPAVTPVPSVDPEVLRKTAAAAYKAAADKANAARLAIDKKYPMDMTLKQARSYFAALAKVEGSFVVALKKIIVPPDTASDLKTLIVRVNAVQSLYVEMSRARSIADVNGATADLTRVNRQASAAANQLRSDLSLPPVGS